MTRRKLGVDPDDRFGITYYCHPGRHTNSQTVVQLRSPSEGRHAPHARSAVGVPPPRKPEALFARLVVERPHGRPELGEAEVTQPQLILERTAARGGCGAFALEGRTYGLLDDRI